MTQETVEAQAVAPVVQVIYPEEPESYINVQTRSGSKLMRFQYGQLTGEITPDVVDFFQKMNDRAGREKYLIAVDGLSAMQQADLFSRAMTVCAKKASASDPLKIAEDVKLFVAGASNQAAAAPMKYESLVARVSDIVPSILGDKVLQGQVATEQHERADELAILNGLQGNDDTPQPDNIVMDATTGQPLAAPANAVWPSN